MLQISNVDIFLSDHFFSIIDDVAEWNYNSDCNVRWTTSLMDAKELQFWQGSVELYVQELIAYIS